MREKRVYYKKAYRAFKEITVEDGVVILEKEASFVLPALHERVIINDKAVIVFLYDDKGRAVKGVAKCSPQDTFNETKGIKIAYLRAKKKMYERELKQLAK